MSFRRPQPSEPEDEAVNLSGWLYADLLLGLAVVFLGAAFIVVKAVDEPATATPTTTTEAPRDELEALEKDKRVLEGQLATNSTALEEAEGQLATNSTALEEAEVQLATNSTALEEAEGVIGDLGDDLEVAEGVIGDLRDDLEFLFDDLEVAEGVIGDLRDDLEGAEGRIGGLSSELADALEEIPFEAPPGVEKGFYCFRIEDVDGRDSEDLANDLYWKLVGQGILNRTVGIALSFGVSGSVGTGQANAEWFNTTLLRPLSAFNNAAMRHFWNGAPRGSDKPDGSVEVNVYLMTKPGKAQLTGEVEARC
jgi:ABC-type transporter Mla subunit MlaD